MGRPTTEQKVDFLLKKVGYSLSKNGSVSGTGAISGGTTKEPFNESLPSPFVIPDSSIWTQSLSIPTTPPGSDTSIVKVYLAGTSGLRMTVDSTVSGSRAFIAYTTYNNTSSARLTDWIDTQFGSGYVIKVYKGDPNSGGVSLDAAGSSGNDDTWFFDYSSGVLNFNGADLPSGVTDTNIYIVGYRYIGSKGVSSPSSINPTNLYVSGISTFVGVGTFQSDLWAAGQIKGYTNLSAPYSATAKTFTVTVGSKTATHRYNGTGSASGYFIDGIESPFLTLLPGRTYKFDQADNTNSNHQIKFYLEADKTTLYETGVTYNGSAGSAGAYTQIVVGDTTPTILHYQCVNHGYMGNSAQMNSNVVDTNHDAYLRGNLSVTGLSTFTGAIDANGALDVDGQTDLDVLNVSDTATFSGLVDINHNLDVDGHTELDFVNVSAASTFAGIVDVNGTLNVDGHVEADDVNVSGMTSLAQAEVGDLAQNSVVYAGSGGRLKDSSNLKFTDTTSEFEVVGHSVLDTVVASGIVTAGQFSTGASGVGINISGSQITGPEELIIDPAAVGVNTGKVRIKGDLFVDGTSFVVHEGDIEFGDFVVGIASTVPTNALLDGAGIGIGSTGIRKFIRYNHASTSLQSSIDFSVLDGGAFKAGTNSILNKTTLGATVVNSSLQNLGTLTALNVNGTSTLTNVVVGSAVTANSTGVFVTGVTTSTSLVASSTLVAASAKVSDLTDNRVVIAGTGGELEDSSNLTFNGSTLGVTGAVTATSSVVGSAVTSNATGVIVTGVTTSNSFVGALTGNVTGNSTTATDLAINATNRVVLQTGNNATDVLAAGTAGYVLQSNGSGNAPTWVASAASGAIEGITVREEGNLVGTAGSISTLNFVGSAVLADAAALAGIATITVTAEDPVAMAIALG